MEWDVVEVKPEPGFRLQVQFADGTCGRVRFEQSHLTGVFEPLKVQAFFNQAFVDGGAVAWPGDVDLAPDAMYREIRQHGEWVLR
jgi:hypothetical protein